MTTRPRARAFTLLELLVVIAVIATLAGMVLAIVGTVRHRARAADTQVRMQTVLTGLANYAQIEGSAAFSLQQACALGGVGKVASLAQISTVVKAGGGSAASREMPPLLVRPDSSGFEWGEVDMDPSPTGDDRPLQLAQQQPYWKYAWDALPPATGPVARAWYLTQWPLRWPASDWHSVPAGETPPILRFPWGRPGLALNGALCDPAQPVTKVLERLMEFKDLAAWRTGSTADATKFARVSVVNAWVATGGAAAGERIAYTTASAGETSPVVGPVTATRSDGSSVTTEANAPLPFDLGYLSPMRTVALLQAADILPASGGDAAYRSDRSTRQPWNDAWGRPLVVPYALFLPERHQRIATGQNDRHLLWQKALAAYGYNRSVYLAVGAIGPDLGGLDGDLAALAASTTADGDRAPLAAIWKRIALTCDAHTWNETTFQGGAWQGMKAGKKGGMRSFLTAPVEMH